MDFEGTSMRHPRDPFLIIRFRQNVVNLLRKKHVLDLFGMLVAFLRLDVGQVSVRMVHCTPRSCHEEGNNILEAHCLERHEAKLSAARKSLLTLDHLNRHSFLEFGYGVLASSFGVGVGLHGLDLDAVFGLRVCQCVRFLASEKL